jgi:hypothetical protein
MLSCFRFREKSDNRSQWPRGLRGESAAARLLGLWVRISLGIWMSVMSCVVRWRSLRRTDH